MDETKRIKDLYRQYWHFMICKDADGLRSLMADDYYLMHMTGVRQSAEVFLAGLLDGTFNYYSAEHDSIEVVVNGDTAELTGKSRVSAAVYGGRRSTWRPKGTLPCGKSRACGNSQDLRHLHIKEVVSWNTWYRGLAGPPSIKYNKLRKFRK